MDPQGVKTSGGLAKILAEPVTNLLGIENPTCGTNRLSRQQNKAMTNQTIESRKDFAGLASYKCFLNNDPHYYAYTKWHQHLRKKRLRCQPFRLRQMDGFLFVVHDAESELVATRMSVDLTPVHEQDPDWAFFQYLYNHNILAYERSQLERTALNGEVEERLCALIRFEAGADLQPALSALDVRFHWRLDDEGASQ